MLLAEQPEHRVEDCLDPVVLSLGELNIGPVMGASVQKMRVEVMIPNPDVRMKLEVFARVKLTVGQ